MRVLHVIPSLAASDGGPAHALLAMERALRGRGIDVEVACTRGAAAEVLPGDAGVPRHAFRRQSGFYKVSLGLGRWLWRHVREFDLVHVHALFSFSSTAAAFACSWRGVPYVLRPLGTLSGYGMSRRRPWLKRLSFRLLEAQMLRRAAAVQFTSVQEWEEADALGIELRGALVPLAVDAGCQPDCKALLARFPELRGRACVLFLSRLDPKKNLEGLLRAIPSCSAAVPDAHWLLAGEGDAAYAARLRALCVELGIEARVTWAGRLDAADKAAAFAIARVFVLPSHSENFGIAAAEALQAGVPVVLGRGVALSRQVEASGAGTIVDLEPSAIAAAMQAFLLDPISRERAAGNARELALREFSTEAMARRLEEMYRGLKANTADA